MMPFEYHLKKNMFRGLLIAFALTAVRVIYPIQLSSLFGVEALEEDDAMLNILKQIEMRKIKLKILNELGMTEEDSLLSDPRSRPDLPPDVLNMLVSEYEERLSVVEQNDNVPELMIFPVNGDFECEWSGEPSCRRFEYNLPLGADVSSSEFWFRKLRSEPGVNLTVSVFCSESGEELVNKTDQVSPEAEVKWEIHPLSALKEVTSRKREIACEIETSGIAVDDTKPSLPFLKMAKEDTSKEQQRRNRRHSTNPRRHSTCQSVPFRISFEAMGFGNFVVHPTWVMANLCEGYCLKGHSDYESLLDMYFNHHPELDTNDSRCWATCCRPVQYHSMMLIYNDENNTRIVRNFPQAIAARCGCA